MGEDFLNLHCVIECDQPSPDLYEFTGSALIPFDRIELHSGSRTSHPMSHPHIQTLNTANGAATELENPETNSEPRAAHLGGNASPKSQLKSQSSLSLPPFPVSNFLQIPLSMENIALRGTRLKNTDYIYGIVLYAGKDTRLALNSRLTDNTKFSTVEKYELPSSISNLTNLIFLNFVPDL